MKRVLIGLASAGTLMAGAFADIDYSVKAGLNINFDNINLKMPIAVGAEVSKDFGKNAISVSADYFYTHKINAPIFLNYKRKANDTTYIGVGLGTFIDSTKTPAAQLFTQFDIDKNFFAEFKAITRLEQKDTKNFLIIQLGYKF